MRKKYDTKAKRIKTLKKKGNIITFKSPIRWMGKDYKQILVMGFEKSRKTGAVKIIGFARDTNWFSTIEQLIKSVDWAWMEEAHD